MLQFLYYKTDHCAPPPFFKPVFADAFHLLGWHLIDLSWMWQKLFSTICSTRLGIPIFALLSTDIKVNNIDYHVVR